MQTLSKPCNIRAKSNISLELPLLSKLGRATVQELGRRTMVGSNPEGCQGIKGNLHGKISFDSPHTEDETPIA